MSREDTEDADLRAQPPARDDETEEEDDTILVPARLPAFRGGELVYVDGVQEVPAGWTCERGLLLPPPQPEPTPEPDDLWVQTVPTIGPADRPAPRAPYLEIWHGTPAAPDTRASVLLVRDDAAFRDLARWRRALGRVGVEIRRYPNFAPGGRTTCGVAEVLGAVDSWQEPRSGDAADAVAPLILVQLPGTGVALRVTWTGQRGADGLPIYVATAAQVAGLGSRLR